MSDYFAIIGKKCGMTSIYYGDSMIPVTAVEVPDHYIVGVKTVDKDGYNAIIIGVGEKKEKLINKPQREIMRKSGVPFLDFIREFRVDSSYDLSSFSSGQKVDFDFTLLKDEVFDIRSISKGKGFTGVVKRYHFRGQHASRGDSLSHRSHGSTGQRQDPGKVFKGKKMAGHMGAKMVCVQNHSVISFDKERSILFINGSIPGPSGSYAIMNSASKFSFGFVYNSFNFVSLIKSSL